ncbi:hypothetical protein ACFLZG_02085 [Thermodesulfobacteriota bacterium]
MEHLKDILEETIKALKSRKETSWYMHTIKGLEEIKKMNSENGLKPEPLERGCNEVEAEREMMPSDSAAGQRHRGLDKD